LQKSWHGHLAREKRLFSWQIPAMNHGQDARATLFAGPSQSMSYRRSSASIGGCLKYGIGLNWLADRDMAE
jgi:hypothetical protein